MKSSRINQENMVKRINVPKLEENHIEKKSNKAQRRNSIGALPNDLKVTMLKP